MSSNNKFRILSIDGGGIRGVYPAYILECIQERLQIDLRENFDLIAGTSTGSIIAAGIACSKTPNEIVRLYKKHGRNIFGKEIKSFWPKKIKQAAHSRYDKKLLEEVLHSELIYSYS